MSDMISRQTAISAICNACGKIDCDKMDKCEKLQLPPANSSESPNSSDTISRQAAIDAVLGVVPYDEYWKEQIEKAVNALPSAQPVDKAYLCDWYINSVTESEPVWTEAHISELMGDFYIIPKRGEQNGNT